MSLIRESGVTIGDKHSYRDFGLIMTEKSIGEPKAKTNYISVPGRNGVIDATEMLTGQVKYEQRELRLSFVANRPSSEWALFLSKLQNEMQGIQKKLIFDDDPAFYWIGRTFVTMSNTGKVVNVQIRAEVDPYKYNITTSAEDWLWDPFDFEQSIINELYGIEVSGEKTVEIVCNKKWSNVVIIAEKPGMKVAFEGKSYSLNQGSQIVYEVILKPGSNLLKFSGSGNVSINYVGGSL